MDPTAQCSRPRKKDGWLILKRVAGVAPPSGFRAETHLKSGLAYAYGSNVANGVHATDPATLYHSVTDEP